MCNMYRVVTSHSVVMSMFGRNYLSIGVPDILSNNRTLYGTRTPPCCISFYIPNDSSIEPEFFNG